MNNSDSVVRNVILGLFKIRDTNCCFLKFLTKTERKYSFHRPLVRIGQINFRIETRLDPVVTRRTRQ